MKLMLTILLLLSLNTYGQKNLQIFKQSNNTESLTFTYYKDPKSLALNIKHGNYTYIKKSQGLSILTKGRYNNGLLDGKWTVEVKITNNNNSSYDNYNKVLTYSLYTVEFKNGIYDGMEKVVNVEEKYNGITRVARNENEEVRKTESNIIRLVASTTNGITTSYLFDGNGILMAGTYCFTCETKDGLFYNVNEDGIITKFIKSTYEGKKEYEIDNDCIENAKKFSQGLITKEKLEEINFHVETFPYYGSSINNGLAESYLPKDGIINKIAYNNPTLVTYIYDRNQLLSTRCAL